MGAQYQKHQHALHNETFLELERKNKNGMKFKTGLIAIILYAMPQYT